MIHIDELIKQATWTEEDAAQSAYDDRNPSQSIQCELDLEYEVDIINNEEGRLLKVKVLLKNPLEFIITDKEIYKSIIAYMFANNISSDELYEYVGIKCNVSYSYDNNEELQFDDIETEISSERNIEVFNNLTNYILSFKEVEDVIDEKIINEIENSI